MGQYHLIVNLDKREFLHPHQFGDGLKLMEFGQSAGGTLTGLVVLLAAHNGRGGGDFVIEHPEEQRYQPGCWAGDRILIVGDYWHDEDSRFESFTDLWAEDPKDWTDISSYVADMLRDAGEIGPIQEERRMRRASIEAMMDYNELTREDRGYKEDAERGLT